MDRGGGLRMESFGELLDAEACLTPIITFSEALDNIVGGGIELKKVTEMYGDKGSGKTTLCCQLAIDVQIPGSLGGLGAECLFMDTENSFVVNRLETMATHCVQHCLSLDPASSLTPQSLLHGIHLVRCGDVAELRSFVSDLREFLRVYPQVKLVVIDSLAFVFYGTSEQFSERGKVLYELFQTIHKVASELGIAVVVTNNMTTRFSASGTDYRIPFLGDTWTHIPNTRIHLKFDGSLRTAHVVKGKVSPNKTVFSITEAGIR